MPKKPEPEPVPAVLIPILSKHEDNPDFLRSATEGFDNVVLLAVIDRTEIVGRFGFMANEIRSATQLVEKIRGFLENQDKLVEDLVEWGETNQKICHIAELKNCSKIVLAKQDNQYFRKLLKKLGEETKAKLEVVPIALEEPKKA